jgi:hypothetical protein
MNGRFHFADLPQGEYVLGVLHAAIDSIGLDGLTAKAIAGTTTDTVTISIPSFETIWRRACGRSPAPADSNLLLGTIRTATQGRAVPRATLRIRWSNLSFNRSTGVIRAAWGGDVMADSNGVYRVCGVPSDEVVRIQASSGPVVTPIFDLPPTSTRVQRQDIMLPATGNSSLSTKGVVAGVVRDSHRRPIAGARVNVDGLPEVRTSDDGRFILRDVSSGTRQLEVLSVGKVPRIALVDVTPLDTTVVELNLETVTTLGPVSVTANYARQRRADEIAQRRKLGLGHFIDSTSISVHGSVANAVEMIISLDKICGLYVDGALFRESDIPKELRFRNPKDIAVVESLRGISVPFQYRIRDCDNRPIVLLWTKQALP